MVLLGRADARAGPHHGQRGRPGSWLPQCSRYRTGPVNRATVTDVPSGARNWETITAGRAVGFGAGRAADGVGVLRAVLAGGRLAAGVPAAFWAVLAVAEHAARPTATAAPSGHAAARICSSLGAGHGWPACVTQRACCVAKRSCASGSGLAKNPRSGHRSAGGSAGCAPPLKFMPDPAGPPGRRKRRGQ